MRSGDIRRRLARQHPGNRLKSSIRRRPRFFCHFSTQVPVVPRSKTPTGGVFRAALDTAIKNFPLRVRLKSARRSRIRNWANVTPPQRREPKPGPGVSRGCRRMRAMRDNTTHHTPLMLLHQRSNRTRIAGTYNGHNCTCLPRRLQTPDQRATRLGEERAARRKAKSFACSLTTWATAAADSLLSRHCLLTLPYLLSRRWLLMRPYLPPPLHIRQT